MIQKTLPVGRLQCNCQLLVCEKTFQAVIVDPGDEAKKILELISKTEAELKQKIKVKALFHTHAHFDHIGATREVKEHFSKAGVEAPSIYLHQGDEFIYKMLPKQSAMFGFHHEDSLPVDSFFQDEEEIQFGTLKFKILHTPGHSPGGVCFHLKENTAEKVPEVVFTGDTLFKGDIGRADLWGGDEPTLIKSIRNRLLTLDSDTKAWPGHGLSTEIGWEKKNNPYI